MHVDTPRPHANAFPKIDPLTTSKTAILDLQASCMWTSLIFQTTHQALHLCLAHGAPLSVHLQHTQILHASVWGMRVHVQMLCLVDIVVCNYVHMQVHDDTCVCMHILLTQY